MLKFRKLLRVDYEKSWISIVAHILESQLFFTDIFLSRDIKCMNAFFKGEPLVFSDAQ